MLNVMEELAVHEHLENSYDNIETDDELSGVFIDGVELTFDELEHYEEHLKRSDDYYDELLDGELYVDSLGVDADDDTNHGGFRRIVKEKRDFV